MGTTVPDLRVAVASGVPSLRRAFLIAARYGSFSAASQPPNQADAAPENHGDLEQGVTRSLLSRGSPSRR